MSVVIAHLQIVVFIQHLRELHEEVAVVWIFLVANSFHLRLGNKEPALLVHVAPVALPLLAALAVRVEQMAQAMRVALYVLDLAHLYQAVSMVHFYPLRSLLPTADGHGQILLCGIHQLFPHVVLVEGPSLVVFVQKVQRDGGCAREIVQTLLGVAAFYLHVAVVQLGPRFFHQHHPQLLVLPAREQPFAVLGGEPVVHQHVLPHAAPHDGQRVHPHGVLLSGLLWEQVYDARRVLSQRRQDGQQVAVAQLALLDVTWLDAAGEHVELPVLPHFYWAAPLNFGVFLVELRVPHVDAVRLRGKGWVRPRLVQLQQFE